MKLLSLNYDKDRASSNVFQITFNVFNLLQNHQHQNEYLKTLSKNALRADAFYLSQWRSGDISCTGTSLKKMIRCETYCIIIVQ